MFNIIEKASQFPPLRYTIQNALAKVEDQESTTEEVATAIASDTGLATMILKLANSPFYGVSKQIASITDACVLIGRYSLRNVVLTLSVYDKVQHTDVIILDREALWRESLLAGCIASEIASRKRLSRDVALTAGIFHKLGKLVLAWADPERYKQVLDYQKKFETSDIESEQPLLNHNHAEIGALVLSSWLVPEDIVKAVKEYPFQECTTKQPFASIVHVASKLAQWLLKHDLNTKSIPEDLIPEYLVEYLSLEKLSMSEILETSLKNFQQFKID